MTIIMNLILIIVNHMLIKSPMWTISIHADKFYLSLIYLLIDFLVLMLFCHRNSANKDFQQKLQHWKLETDISSGVFWDHWQLLRSLLVLQTATASQSKTSNRAAGCRRTSPLRPLFLQKITHKFSHFVSTLILIIWKQELVTNVGTPISSPLVAMKHEREKEIAHGAQYQRSEITDVLRFLTVTLSRRCYIRFI